jgi:ATP-dependent Zn protease
MLPQRMLQQVRGVHRDAHLIAARDPPTHWASNKFKQTKSNKENKNKTRFLTKRSDQSNKQNQSKTVSLKQTKKNRIDQTNQPTNQNQPTKQNRSNKPNKRNHSNKQSFNWYQTNNITNLAWVVFVGRFYFLKRLLQCSLRRHLL